VTEGILRDTAYAGQRPAVTAMRPARQAAGRLAMLRLVPYLRARRSELSTQAWFQLLTLWRSLCGTLPLYDYLLRPAGLLFTVMGGLLLRSVRSLDGFLDDRVALLRAQRRAISRPVTALAFLMAVVLLLSFTLFGTGLEVFIDGDSIGFVGSEAEFDAALREVETRVSEILGRPFSVAPDVRYRFGTVNRHRIFDHDQVVNQLFGQISDVRRLFALTVDGTVVAALENPADIELVLEMVEETFLPTVPGLLDHGFAEHIQIERRWVDANLLTSFTGLESLLLNQRRTAQVTTLAAGETVAAVAARYGMSEQGLLALNDTDAIEVGKPVVVSEAVTVLTVVATARRVYTEEIDFDIDFIDDHHMFVGEVRILVDGVSGLRRVTEEVTYRNGIEIHSVVTNTEVIEEPVVQQYALGRMPRPTTAPYGVFWRPLAANARVSLTSGFGWRRLNGVLENHTGVDWSAPFGTAIRAADGGTVVEVGNLGNRSYGRYVIIDHGQNARGQNIRTLYAHCSRIIVTQGQKVARGDNIAFVGSTGRSTGNHLHFEVLINRVPVNPFSNTHSNVPR
jgi:murein DD-endopeptidase MepM/ murein hydrolase activator NlpD